ncbi:hypothetical protein ACP86_21835 [Marinobacter sp. CP1]|jgi:tetratricopeptide (TPR) repeat protein|uniref:tetratricopeptide repeat protein n=1 Tax=unclassified Marinobacter TaxID=83889 RepID=UPI00069D9BD0|nr:MULTISPECIES: tetratricopeptide repeat protein [unclassified Marinobacter]AKV98546.1 hypothetical protein ACP86_21835 [Marinobacter sp. CP1]
MKVSKAICITLFSLFAISSLSGCSDETEMTQEEIQYIGHIDQARFFQRQGELKASTLEARSAIELQPDNAEPYFIIIDNLLTAGDATNAERQVNLLADRIVPEALNDTTHNRIKLIRAKSRQLKGEGDEALDILSDLQNPDRPQELQAALLKADILLSQRQLTKAEQAYKNAAGLEASSAKPLIGLSKVAYARDNQDQVAAYIAEAEAIDANSTELWLWKARVAQAKSDWQVAEEAYIRALEDIGQYDIMTYRKYETISSLIRVLREQGKASEAFVYEEMLAKSAPGTIRSNLEAAQAAYQDGNLEESARYLEEILKQSPGHEQSALLLGMIRFRQGRMEEADRLLTPIAANEDAEEAAKLLAATKIQLRNIDDARAILDSLDDKETDPGVLAMVGITTLAGGENAAGEELIEKSLELRPDNSELRLRYSRYLIEQNKIDRALDQLENVIEQDPSSSNAKRLKIEAYLKAENNDAAVSYADEWLKEDPESLDAKLVRGQLALALGNQEQAEKFYTAASQDAPEDPTPLLALGALERSRENLESAGEYFKRAVSLAPNNRQALQGLTSSLPGTEVADFLGELSEKKPEAAGPRLILLEYALFNGDTEKSTDHLAVLMEPVDENTPSRLSPLVAAIFGNVASQKSSAGDLADARAILERALALFPENENIILQAANLAYQTDRQQDAKELLQDAKLTHPESARPFILEAGWMTQEQRHQEAAELYQLALEKRRSAETELRYAQALQRSNQTTKAIEVMESARSTYPNNLQITFALALAYQQADRQEEARSTYELVLEDQPDNVIALNNLAWLYQQAGDPRALEIAKRAYELRPDSGAVADTYGWILFNAGQEKESVAILEKAHQAQPESNEIALHLAEAYKAVGEQEKAKEILEKFK